MPSTFAQGKNKNEMRKHHGAEVACWAHNPKVSRSIRLGAIFFADNNKNNNNIN